MAKQTRPTPKSRFSFGWRGFAVFLLSFLGVLALVVFLWAHWTERQLLTTRNWVKLVAPLPKNDAVASSLSDFSVNRLFDKINLDQKIADALPPKASFLAEPLSNQLEQRTKTRAKQVIQSDRFQGIWIEANRTAHQKLVDKARGNESPNNGKLSAVFNLDLSGLGASIRDKLGQDSSPLFSNDNQAGPVAKIGIGVKLKTSFEKFKKFVNTVDFLNSVLGFLALASLLWAVALTRQRHRLVMILTSVIGVIALLQIIGVKALRPVILNQIETKSYRPAVGVIYDDLVSAFQHSSTVLFIVSVFVFIIAFLIGTKVLNQNKRVADFMRSAKKHRAYKTLSNLRKQTGKYRYALMGLVALAVLVALAIQSGYDWQGIIRALLFTLMLCALIRLFAVLPNTRRRKSPM